ncbi:unnamed protein product [Allacma fusca]|uniref:Uncharacterized protein n=1 Tax=Allacma fusca TaxID=39272 RepID=A0A8J2P795_9HEXA|nr:unnamed protein product [Allacma fusca]
MVVRRPTPECVEFAEEKSFQGLTRWHRVIHRVGMKNRDENYFYALHMRKLRTPGLPEVPSTSADEVCLQTKSVIEFVVPELHGRLEIIIRAVID